MWIIFIRRSCSYMYHYLLQNIFNLWEVSAHLLCCYRPNNWYVFFLSVETSCLFVWFVFLLEPIDPDVNLVTMTGSCKRCKLQVSNLASICHFLNKCGSMQRPSMQLGVVLEVNCCSVETPTTNMIQSVFVSWHAIRLTEHVQLQSQVVASSCYSSCVGVDTPSVHTHWDGLANQLAAFSHVTLWSCDPSGSLANDAWSSSSSSWHEFRVWNTFACLVLGLF